MIKKELKKSVLAKRQKIVACDYKLKSAQICSNIKEFIFKKSNKIKSIGLYSPFKNEPDITTVFIALSDDYSFYFPFVEKDLEFKKVESLNNLVKGKFSIDSPITEAETGVPDLLIIPCVAVSKSFYRLGMGGGYYDRYLAKHKNIIKCAVVFDEFDNLDFKVDSWDIKMDYVVSDLEVRG